MKTKNIILLGLACWVATPQVGMGQANNRPVLSAADSLEIQKLEHDLAEGKRAEVMNEVFGTPKYNIKTIGILVYNGVNDLDMMGPATF